MRLYRLLSKNTGIIKIFLIVIIYFIIRSPLIRYTIITNKQNILMLYINI
ncbi:hypothetical protein A1OE_933 [Candidatus Endolissoclinum faulkneri L2]|uniref:Uncharacterized protein n=1 Tax=Candidatus Endolissoclinum faulkneri L2 TaxID=1193729 RepID=K7ZD25_9PROT|nr:hypothetical protein A1OE_933 [Candidatus Endolissoclinum faulkneri L2]